MLHVAAGLGGLLTVQKLLELGATPNVLAPDGLSPADYAAAGGYQDIATLLRDHGASQTFDWTEWQPAPEEVLVTSVGNPLRITWAGVVVALRTRDGKPPREDMSNLEFKVRATWTSSESPYECFQEVVFDADEVKDAKRRSLAMRDCGEP